jgi:hypothetical protein
MQEMGVKTSRNLKAALEAARSVCMTQDDGQGILGCLSFQFLDSARRSRGRL